MNSLVRVWNKLFCHISVWLYWWINLLKETLITRLHSLFSHPAYHPCDCFLNEQFGLVGSACKLLGRLLTAFYFCVLLFTLNARIKLWDNWTPAQAGRFRFACKLHPHPYTPRALRQLRSLFLACVNRASCEQCNSWGSMTGRLSMVNNWNTANRNRKSTIKCKNTVQ